MKSRRNKILLVIFIQSVLFAAQCEKISEPLNCSNVCGVGNEDGKFPKRFIPTLYLFDDQCLNASQQSTKIWKESAQQFMKYIGRDFGRLECLTQNVSYGAAFKPYRNLNLSLFQIRTFGNVPKFTDSSKYVSLNEPRNVPGFCRLYSDRAIFRTYGINRREDAEWIPSLTVSSGDPPKTRFSLFALVKEGSKDAISVRVPRNANDSCIGEQCNPFKILLLPASTFNTSVPYKSEKIGKKMENMTEGYSMFTKWDLDDIPGISELLDNRAIAIDKMQNVDNDLSLSNLSILSLPLLLAMLPISVFESVSDKATIVYVIATDLLAVLPLLIKGVELIVTYRNATPSMASWLSLRGEQYGIFERWHLDCFPPPGRVGSVGRLLVSISVWFIFASSYAEYVVWRALRLRQGRWQNIESQAHDLPIGNTDSDAGDGFVETQKNGINARRISVIVLCILVITTSAGLMVCLIAMNHSLVNEEQRQGLSHKWSLVLSLLLPFLLVLLRAFMTRRLYQFARPPFLLGILCGFVSGPLYLLLHVHPKIRKSSSWAEIGEGANIGYAFMTMTVYFIFSKTFENLNYVNGAVQFYFVLFLATIILHAIRSTKEDKLYWRYAIHGFILGFLFNVFGLLFRRCFPELSDVEKIRLNFYSGLASGVLLAYFLVLNVLLILPLWTLPLSAYW